MTDDSFTRQPENSKFSCQNKLLTASMITGITGCILGYHKFMQLNTSSSDSIGDDAINLKIRDRKEEESNFEYPGNNCCILFNKAEFKGDSMTFCLDNAWLDSDIFNMKDYDFNDAMTSWHCGKDIAYDFC